MLAMNASGNPAGFRFRRRIPGPGGGYMSQVFEFAKSLDEVPAFARYEDVSGRFVEKLPEIDPNLPAWARDEEIYLLRKYGSGVRYAGD